MLRIRSFLGSDEVKLKKELDEIHKKLEISENVKEKGKLDKSPLQFYDIIIGIDSIKKVKEKGWNVYISQKGKEIVDSEEKNKNLVIGVLGNRNKGKSFILQSLSSEDLQTGTAVSTIGLSIKVTNENYVLLDSAGSESPLLGNYEDMREISRDKLFTEAFLQAYIMKYSNILLLVVGILTFYEQKLIKRITTELKKLNQDKKNKYLIVIHNLQTYETKEQVDKYIKETLLHSATFKLEKGEANFKGNKNEYYYDNEDEAIRHFVFAKENSEAGNFYNPKTIDFIMNMNQICTNVYNYSYKDTLMEYFKQMGKEMFENKSDLKYELSENENVEIEEDEEIFFQNLIVQKNNLQYKGENEINLRKFIIDELGSSSFVKNGFNPEYECYYDKNELVINIDCSGEDTVLKAKRIKNKGDGPDYYIEITGERKCTKKEEKDIVYIKEREIGNLYLLIPFYNKKLVIGKPKKEDVVNGIQTFRFPLEEIDDED